MKKLFTFLTLFGVLLGVYAQNKTIDASGSYKYQVRIDNERTLEVNAVPFAILADKSICMITLQADDVWGDGSGYQMLLDADANTFGVIFPATGAFTVSGDAPAGAYDEFEFKIPVNADGVLTTSNIIMNGQESIFIPAGTYDWVITNPTPGDRLWIASDNCDPGRADNAVFEAGYHYTFAVSFGGTNDCVTHSSAFTSVEENAEVAINIYPNPASDFVVLTQYADVDVFNVYGQIIGTYTNVNGIDVSSFDNGMYIFRIRMGESVISKNISIVR